jgi:hypothetical protein
MQYARAEAGLNGAFTVEVALRVAALGSFWRYIKQPWNAFDFIMVRTFARLHARACSCACACVGCTYA